MSEEIITSKHWLVLTNPCRKTQIPQAKQLCALVKKKARIPYILVTKYSGHAVEITILCQKKLYQLPCFGWRWIYKRSN